MAYYNKKEIANFISTACEKVKNEKHTPITDPQKPLKELTDESDLVGFFWLELSSNGENGVGIKMEGKVFVRIDYDVYTDDRFALDSYHAAKEKISVVDMIKKRDEEKKNAKDKINPDALESLKNFLLNKADDVIK